MSTSAATFTGTSAFSADLQNSITRAVSIANLPITQLQNEESSLNGKAAALGTLSSNFTALQSSITALASASGSGAVQASVSDNTIVTASAAANTIPGSYTVDVLDPGSVGSALSNSGLTTVTDPNTQSLSSSSSFTLTVNGKTFTITPSAKTLNALTDSINQSGAGVQATILNLGSSSSPDYRLSIQGADIGALSAQLNDGTNDLLSSVASGSNASYTVNGQPSGGIATTSRTVTVTPGLTVNLEKVGVANVFVARSTTSISNALSSFVSAYNAITAELAATHGQSTDALASDSIVGSASSTLRSIVNYTTGSTGVNTLYQLGIGFDQSGNLTFDSSVLNSLSQNQIQQATSFLGDSTSGFIQTASDAVNGMNDVTDGQIATEVNSITESVANLQTQISTAQARVTQMQTALTAQVSAADALIASLEQQTNYVTALFATANANNNAPH